MEFGILLGTIDIRSIKNDSLLSDKQNSASGRAMHFSNGKTVSQLDLNKADILVCEV